MTLIIFTLITTVVLLVLDYKKTITGLKKGIKMFLGILPDIFKILIFISIIFYLIPSETLAHLIGKESGFIGKGIAALLGSISLIPGFIAYPLSGALLTKGVDYDVIAIFITTLMMVGIITFPLEAKYFGVKVAILRNVLSFIGAIIIGLLVGVIL